MTNKPVKANKDIEAVMGVLGANQLEQKHGYKNNPKKAMQLKLLVDLITEARIDELKKVPEDEDYFTAIKIHPYIDKRIKALSEGRLE